MILTMTSVSFHEEFRLQAFVMATGISLDRSEEAIAYEGRDRRSQATIIC